MPASRRLIVTGTDTGVGKTVLAAALVSALQGAYWKPVQAGLDGLSDSDVVRRLAGLPPDRVLPEAYRLTRAVSPHIAAATDGISVDAARLAAPATDRPLVIEGAGGLMVPLSPSLLQIDQFAAWEAPIILCARTTLGTINHTLLSLEALRVRALPVMGVAFIGDGNPAVETTIATLVTGATAGAPAAFPEARSDFAAAGVRQRLRHRRLQSVRRRR